MNAIQEGRLMDRFKEAYPDFPAGMLTKAAPPLPDYILETVKGKIGIELTEVFHPGKGKQQSSFKDQITEKVIERLSPTIPFCFSLDISLDPAVIIPKPRINKLTLQLAQLCQKEFFRLTNGQTAEIEQIEVDIRSREYASVRREILAGGYRNLPNGISSICMSRHDQISESYNASSQGGIVPNLTLDVLQPCLLKKETLIPKYSLKEHWLVIQEGNYFSGSFTELAFSLPISSLFDKVFLFRLSGSQVVVLK